MCGIAGLVGTARRDRGPEMRAMRERLVHRGPDSAGEYADEGVALGVRRLRIIDLETGDQPIANEDGSVWTVFNGEIYNFRELRDELAGRGHRFRTRSDTEVVVHLYEELGDALVERLEGMFALAVWDARRRALVLARDRLGKKPLLYATRDGELVFASEHRALLAGLCDSARPNLSAIALYLRLGYVPAPTDAFAGVRKLPPAHVLVWREGTHSLRRYWKTPEPGSLRITEEEAVAELRRLFERAVERRLVADVPLGAFLSGGIDSSAVVATMARLSGKVRTFTIGFREREYSEIQHARRVAERFGTEHHEFVVEPLDVDVLPLLARHYGEPYADSSALPTYHLSKLTHEHVTVALAGDGGDELFGGYDRYVAMRLAATLDRLPRFARRVLAAAAEVVPAWESRHAAARLRRFASGLPEPTDRRYLGWVTIFDKATTARVATPEFHAIASAADALPPLDGALLDGRDPVAAAQEFDLAVYLPDDLLVKVDIASMANSLEVRCPFLDRELVEFVVRLPTELKIRGTRRKVLLTEVFADVLPRENVARPKQGFALPIGRWFRAELRPFVTDLLLSERALARGYFDRRGLEALLREHLDGRADHAHRLWSLVMLELWHREFLDG